MANINQYNAAQNKAVIARFLGDTEMWSEAILELYLSQCPQAGPHMTGNIHPASGMMLDDVQINYLSYGDLTICCGDTRLAEYHINLDITPLTQTQSTNWYA